MSKPSRIIRCPQCDFYFPKQAKCPNCSYKIYDHHNFIVKQMPKIDDFDSHMRFLMANGDYLVVPESLMAEISTGSQLANIYIAAYNEIAERENRKSYGLALINKNMPEIFKTFILIVKRFDWLLRFRFIRDTFDAIYDYRDSKIMLENLCILLKDTEYAQLNQVKFILNKVNA